MSAKVKNFACRIAVEAVKQIHRNGCEDPIRIDQEMESKYSGSYWNFIVHKIDEGTSYMYESAYLNVRIADYSVVIWKA